MLIRAYERQLSYVLIHISSQKTGQALSSASVAVETLSKMSSLFASRILLKLDPSLISTKCHQFISQRIVLENKHAGPIFYSSTRFTFYGIHTSSSPALYMTELQVRSYTSF